MKLVFLILLIAFSFAGSNNTTTKYKIEISGTGNNINFPSDIGVVNIIAGSHSIKNTIKDILTLKQVDVTLIENNQFVFVEGFDHSGDGCGGLFYWNRDTLTNTLDGVAMNSDISGGGSWLRYFDGPIHTKWAGIKPTTNPDQFDPLNIGIDNKLRWNNLNNFCKVSIWELIEPNKANVVVNSIFVDAGIHDFVGGTIHVGQGVGLDGTGPGKSILRFNTNAGVCVQVGDEHTGGDPSFESSFDIIKNIGIVHFSLTSTGSETGIAFDNTIRRSELFNVHVSGFGTNVDINAFGMDIRHCFINNGFTRNLFIGPNANSMMIVGCRIDDQRNPSTGENILIEHQGGARNILFQRCDIQRSQRVALKVIGVSSLAIRDCFFEGNNRANLHHPDIWIEGEEVRNIVIDGSYFTGTARFGGTTSRAINLRNDLTSNARIQITNNQQADNNQQGTFLHFIDIDANVGLKLVEFNNLHNSPNNIPENVIIQTF